MQQNIFQITLVIDEYDKAIKYYTETLNFDLLENTDLGNGKRWVRISPPGSKGLSLLLGKAKTKKQIKSIGNQTGGRVFLFLHTDDAKRDYKYYREKNVTIIRDISIESYGLVFVFKDTYGNLWDIIQPPNEINLKQQLQ